MYQFYYPDGEIIAAPDQTKKFVEFYDQCYYLEVAPFEEQAIENILHKHDSLTNNDIIKILEWKTGGKYKEEEEIIQTRYRKISVRDVMEKMHIIRGPLAKDKAKSLLKELCKINGIGVVYAITFLYFITNGKQYPIYDKFAHIALLAILSGNKNPAKKYGGLIPIKDNTCGKKISMETSDTDGIFEQYLNEYVYQINRIFGSDFGCNYGEVAEANLNRDIDRALWVYGHLFNENKKNEKRLGIN